MSQLEMTKEERVARRLMGNLWESGKGVLVPKGKYFFEVTCEVTLPPNSSGRISLRNLVDQSDMFTTEVYSSATVVQRGTISDLRGHFLLERDTTLAVRPVGKAEIDLITVRLDRL